MITAEMWEELITVLKVVGVLNAFFIFVLGVGIWLQDK